ncbi:MAG: hypothetical protein HY712_04790 [candidate division NC10 bacterium]|nr:hypothetical protein [candidate division NC10 bacterium]
MGDGESEPEIREWLEELRGIDLADSEVEAAADRLLAIGTAALPVLLDMYSQQDETLLALATQALKRWPAPHPIEPLIALLRDPTVDDMAKALILILLEGYGLDPTSPEVFGLSINLEDYPLRRPPVMGGPWS